MSVRCVFALGKHTYEDSDHLRTVTRGSEDAGSLRRTASVCKGALTSSLSFWRRWLQRSKKEWPPMTHSFWMRLWNPVLVRQWGSIITCTREERRQQRSEAFSSRRARQQHQGGGQSVTERQCSLPHSYNDSSQEQGLLLDKDQLRRDTLLLACLDRFPAQCC